jgi:Glycosyl transferase family 2
LTIADSRTHPASTGVETLPVTVVVCAFTERRWAQTRRAIGSVLAQSPRPEQVILVIDHNAELAALARQALSRVDVLESDGTPGLSGARNTGLKAATQPVTAFLDDDAEARPGWLASLVEPYHSGHVVATGGSVTPRWPSHRRPWLPSTFYWVVGCSYQGLPETSAAVRNPIGANMSVKTRLALAVGAFNTDVGRIGGRPRGCEETELAIRLTRAAPGSAVWYVPDAAVDHDVAADRLTWRYFLQRCWHEGMSKADVVRLAGASAGLQSERQHMAAVIPKALLCDLRKATTGDVRALARVAAMLAGAGSTAAGYCVGSLRVGLSRRLTGPANARGDDRACKR